MNGALPGGDLLDQGLRDLRAGRRSVEALLVLTAAPRLTRCGFQVPRSPWAQGLPEHALYDLLVAEHGGEAYRQYRSLLRRLVSLEHALESLTPEAGRT